MRLAHTLATFLSAVALLLGSAAAADLAGRHVGIGEADGMVLDLKPGGRGLRGALTLPDGVEYAVDAERVGEAAEAALTMPEGPVFLRLTPHPSGLIATLAPLGPGGTIERGAVRAYAFVPEGTPMPDIPTRFLPEPSAPPRAMDAEAFVASYPFWSPLAAAWGYDAVAPRYRTVIRLFPLVQADLLAKICRSPERTRGIAEALAGQGVTCQDVINRTPESGGAKARFDEAVARERRLLRTALDCATDLTRTRDECARASEETARRAASMETVGTALARF